MIFTTPKNEDIFRCLGHARSPHSRSTTVLFLLWDCYDLERPSPRRKRHLHVGRTDKISGSAKPYIRHYKLIQFRLQSYTITLYVFPGLFDRTHVRLIMGHIVPVLVTPNGETDTARPRLVTTLCPPYSRLFNYKAHCKATSHSHATQWQWLRTVHIVAQSNMYPHSGINPSLRERPLEVMNLHTPSGDGQGMKIIPFWQSILSALP